MSNPKNSNIFYRREQGNCQVCWSADADTDIEISGKASKVITKVLICIVQNILVRIESSKNFILDKAI